VIDLMAATVLEVAGVVIHPSDPAWSTRYGELAQMVASALPSVAMQIDHVGSTSVPGLASKDVIDIQVTIARLVDADKWPAEIAPLPPASVHGGPRAAGRTAWTGLAEAGVGRRHADCAPPRP
jgi:dephospho-CoA kinase